MVAKDKLFDEALELRNVKGNLSGALEKVNQILAYDPGCIKAVLFKSTLHRDLGELNEARTILQDVLEKIPEDSLAFRSDALRLLGFLELLQGNLDIALTQAEKAQKLAEESESYEMMANTGALLGNIYHAREDLDKALEYYMEALDSAQQAKFFEREITLSINIATIHGEKGDTKKALEMLDDVLERSKGKWSKAPFNALFEKIKIHIKIKDISDELVESIIKGYKQATAQGWADEEGNLALQLGLVYYDLDQKDLAKEYLEKALEVFSEAKLPTKVENVESELRAQGFLNDKD